MNLRQMEVFRAVMQTGGLRGAAELLNVSEPAVSKMLSQTQRRLGYPLFQRVKGRLVPTPEGHALYAEVDALWRGVERVMDFSRTLGSPRGGTLNLAVSASLATWLVPQALARLTQRYPELQVRMEILVPPIMVEALLDQSADLGIALLPNEHPNLVRMAQYACGLACVVPARHRLAARSVVLPADLLAERVIGSSPDTPYGQALQRAYGRAAKDLHVGCHVRSAASACWLVQAGAGIAVVDRAAVAGSTFGDLVVRPFRTRERLPVAVIRNRYRPPSVLQSAFAELFDAVWQDAGLA